MTLLPACSSVQLLSFTPQSLLGEFSSLKLHLHVRLRGAILLCVFAPYKLTLASKNSSQTGAPSSPSVILARPGRICIGVLLARNM